MSKIFWCSAKKYCWNTNPIEEARSPASSRSDSPATSSPATLTVPLLAWSKVPATCSSVVFPDPDGPSTPASSPAAT